MRNVSSDNPFYTVDMNRSTTNFSTVQAKQKEELREEIA